LILARENQRLDYSKYVQEKIILARENQRENFKGSIARVKLCIWGVCNIIK
jgi:hypothetical protein